MPNVAKSGMHVYYSRAHSLVCAAICALNKPAIATAGGGGAAALLRAGAWRVRGDHLRIHTDRGGPAAEVS
jgi:hypothetical protein